MIGLNHPRNLDTLHGSVEATLQAYSAVLNELFEAAVIGGAVEFERYSMVEVLVDALADVLRCFTVLEPAEEVEP